MTETARTGGRLTVRFNDNSSRTFAIPTQAVDEAALSKWIDDVLKAQYIMIESDGQLLVFPLANVKSIEASPAPARLPATVIRGGHAVDLD